MSGGIYFCKQLMKRGSGLCCSLLSFFYNLVIDFTYPAFCLLCDKSLSENEDLVCHDCWESLPWLDSCFVPATVLLKCDPSFLFLDSSFALCEYTPQVQKLIHFMKYRGLKKLAFYFGRVVGDYLNKELAFTVDALVPVPLHRKRQSERGYNQAYLLCTAIAEKCSIPVYGYLLERVRYTASQVNMNREERMENVFNAFQLIAGPGSQLKTVALVDDVLTTGSTLNECARILKKAGVEKVICISIARV